MSDSLKTNIYHFIFMDIVGFSKPGIFADLQKVKLDVLDNIIKKSGTFSKYKSSDLRILPTGDGMVIGFPKSCEEPIELAFHIQKKLAEYNKGKDKPERIELRIGLHSGLVYSVKDILGNDNVTCPGIIRARRVMDFGDAGHILASSSMAEELKKMSAKYNNLIKALGTFYAKHDEAILIYNIYDEQVGNKQNPKVPKTPPAISPIFRFLEAKVKLTLLDSKSLLTKHEYYKKLQNIAKEPVDRHLTVILGDAERKLDELKLEILDGSLNKLDIDLQVDQPLTKEFSILFNSIVFPDKNYEYTQTWEWEEPDRVWRHEFINKSDLFEFEFNYKREMGSFDLKCYERNVETGTESISPIPPERTENGELITLKWSDTNIELNKTLTFRW